MTIYSIFINMYYLSYYYKSVVAKTTFKSCFSKNPNYDVIVFRKDTTADVKEKNLKSCFGKYSREKKCVQKQPKS